MVLKTLLLWLFLCFSYSSYSNTCLPDHEGLCTPGVIITEDTQVEITEDNKGTEIVTTTTTTKTTTTVTVTNEDSGNVLNLPDMAQDWGGEGPANMPSGNACYGLGSDTCAEITGSGNTTSTMGVDGMGTTFIQTVDISDLQINNGGEVKYSIEVDKQDAEDRIYLHITGTNGSNTIFQGTDILSETGVASGYQSYNGSFDFGGVLNKLTIEVGGRDINLAIGPLFDDVSVNVFYNVINTIVTQHITTIEEIYYLNIFDPTEIEFVEEVFEYNDISFDDGNIDFTPIEPETEEITYETVELEIQEFEIEFEIDLPEPEIVTVQAETELELELEIEMEMELPEPEVEEISNEQPEEETTETVEETPVKTEEVEQEEVKQEETKEPIKEPSAKEKAATKIVKKIDDKARYDDAAQIKTLIVMQILGDTKSFFDTQSIIQDNNINEYLDKNLEDQFGVLFQTAQNQTMEDLINGQY
ncbi:hypothetical protein [uncultured Mediterranean phage uvMED]|nr:hypothetical protein [uncultured Mediterranean phage uvMED]